MIIRRTIFLSSAKKTFPCLFVLLPIVTGCVDHNGGQKVEYAPTVEGYHQDIQQRDFNQYQRQFDNRQNGVPIYYGDNDGDYQRYRYDDQPTQVGSAIPNQGNQIEEPPVISNNHIPHYYEGDADSNYRPYVQHNNPPDYYASPETLNDTIPSSSGDGYSSEPGYGDNDSTYYPNYYDMY